MCAPNTHIFPLTVTSVPYSSLTYASPCFPLLLFQLSTTIVTVILPRWMCETIHVHGVANVHCEWWYSQWNRPTNVSPSVCVQWWTFELLLLQQRLKLLLTSIFSSRNEHFEETFYLKNKLFLKLFYKMWFEKHSSISLP